TSLADYTPAISAGHLYVTSTSGEVYSVGLGHGALNWKSSTGVSAFDADSTLAVADGMLIVSSNINTLYAVDLMHKGKVAWKSSAMAFTPEFAVANHTIYLATSPQGPHGSGPSLFALNDANGHMKWQFTTGYVALNPSVANGVVYVSADGPISTNGVFFAVNASTGKKLYSSSGAGPYASYPAIVNGVVYVSNQAWTVASS
ncbi:MAG TPA: PQQ-binding-like beta-propeller repeat protein, partial [Chloroflexota bacterium]|nr:PQQ-binding-like beta-propeller repeat protein [Chloroflexota bacterium]